MFLAPEPPSPSLHPLSFPPSFHPSQSSREKFAWRFLKQVIRSGQKKALSKPSSQPRGPSKDFRETKERKTACPAARHARSAGFQEGERASKATLEARVVAWHVEAHGGQISVITALRLARKGLRNCPSCLCCSHDQTPGQGALG